MEKRKSQLDHDKMVEKIKINIEQKGFKDIKADLPNESKPKEIYGHIPDVTGKKSSLISIEQPLFNIYEVETDDSINDTHTEEQWKAFARYSKEFDKNFIIVVPKNSKPKVESRLKELKITAYEIIEL